MAAYTKVGVGYNVQVAVDAKNKMIVEQEVTNQVVDMGLLTQTAEAARDILGVEQDRCRRRQRLLQDRGYRGLREGGMIPYVPRPQRGPPFSEGFFRKDEFQYDAETDASSARPDRFLRRVMKFGAGPEEDQLLQPRGVPRLPAQIAMHDQFRKVSRLENEAVLDRMADRLAARPEILEYAPRNRRASVRHDQTMDESGRVPDAWSGQGSRRVQPDGARYNLSRAVNILGVDE